MISYKALSRASITLQLIEENINYSCEIFSSNGNILHPYDLNTILTCVVYNEKSEDITDKIDKNNIRWTIWNDKYDEEFKKDWNKKHIGKNPFVLKCDEVDGKVVIQLEIYGKDNLGFEKLLTCNNITIIDISDLLTTTEKPSLPYEGQLWVDSSITPATIWVWKNNTWMMTGTISTIVKNLIKNSNFINYGYDPFEIVGYKKNQFIPIVKTAGIRKWLNIKSDVVSDEDKGISQTTDISEKINKESQYSFQFLAYATNESSLYNNCIIVKIFSINNNNQEKKLYEQGLNNEIKLNRNVCRFFTSFKTNNDTERIKIEILGFNNCVYDFNITQLALYNTSNDYPWQSHPDDTSIALTPESVFNALTRNGEIQGIYSATDPNTGQLQYYFNAEYIKSGFIKGNLIDAKNLKVTKDDGYQTLFIDENGNVFLNVSSLVIGSKNIDVEKEIDSINYKITPQSITTQIENVINNDNEIYTHFKNVITQTSNSFISEITDLINNKFSKFQQNQNGIRETVASYDDKINYKLEMYIPDGNIIYDSNIIYAKVYNGSNEITNLIDKNNFNWYRKSKNYKEDNIWNNTYGKHKKSITITSKDINDYATFYFTVDI